MKRYAIVRGARNGAEVRAYLPDNYQVIAELIEHTRPYTTEPDGGTYPVWILQGEDSHGWTLDGYVIPRLASGTMPAVEIDLSHPAMKHVPA